MGDARKICKQKRMQDKTVGSVKRQSNGEIAGSYG
jgi:hypothetical protein